MQFDVHKNLGRNRKAIPYVVVVQSDRYESVPNRVVVPLIYSSEIVHPNTNLNPVFSVEGVSVVMDPLQTASVRTKDLGPKVTSLDPEYLRITAAMDALIATGR